MNLGIEGKRALVTGSTAGIGLATAELLAAEGATVIVNSRTLNRVEAAMRTIRQAVPNGDLRGVAADVGTSAGGDDLVAKIPDVDILINNVATYSLLPFEN